MRFVFVLLLVASFAMAAIFETHETTTGTPTARFLRYMAKNTSPLIDQNATVFWDFTTGNFEEVSFLAYRNTQCKLLLLSIVLCIVGTTIFILIKTIHLYWKVQLIRERKALMRKGYAPISVIKLTERTAGVQGKIY